MSFIYTQRCAAGHDNPPDFPACRLCGKSLLGVVQSIERPLLGTLRINSGATVDIDRDIVIGRAPAYEQKVARWCPDAGQIQFVAIPSSGQTISRNHCLVKVRGWQVELIDLGSNNGTRICYPDGAVRRAEAGQAVLIQPGDLVDIGEGIYLRFE